MFFSHDILQRRGGKFGIVWLAATKCTSVPLSRREYCAVSVSKTCDDIVQYICLEALPLRPRGARPRLSLYLSSQLMFGVARVYGKQMEYLNAEVRDLYMRFTTARLTLQTTEGTDVSLQLTQNRRAPGGTTMPDPLDDTQDSSFGVMRFHEGRSVAPTNLPYIDLIPDIFLVTSEHSTSPQPKRADEGFNSSPQTVSNASDISIKEVPEPPTLIIPDDADLPSIGQDLDSLMGTIGTFEETPVEEGVKDTIDQPITKDAVSASGDEMPKVTDQSERRISHESTLKDGQLDIHVEEESTVQTTPTHPSQIPNLRLLPLPTSPAVTLPSIEHRPRGRRLFSVVVDDFTQLSKQYIRNNMATSNKLCYTSEQILPVAPLLTAKQLLELPGRRSLTMSKKLMALWKSKAVPNVSAKSIVSYQTVRRDKETSSATESLSSQVQGSNQEIMPGSPERPRDVSVDSATGSRMEETPPIFSDLSQLSESRDSTQPSFQIEHTTGRQKRHLTGQSIEEETTTPLDKTGMEIPVPTLQLEGIPETHKSPENSSSEEDQPIKIHHQKVVRDIAELTAVDETITFKDLVPLSTSCARASKVFSICVEFAASNLIVIWQTIAYGDIYIKRGELF